MTTKGVSEVGLFWGSTRQRARGCSSCPKAAKIMNGELDSAVVRGKDRHVEVLELLVRTESHVVAVRVDVRYSNILDHDAV